MKARLAALLLLLAGLAAPAQAEVVGDTQDGFIHRYTAGNGQEIYYVSAMEEETVLTEDVNFDGEDDLVVLTALGASNAFYEFYVWDGAQYVLAWRDALTGSGIPNYTLYPEKGLVCATANNGWAGMLHETVLFCWEGTSMRRVRSAVSNYPVETTYDGSIITETTDTDGLCIRVTEPEYDENGCSLSDRVLYERDMTAEQAFEQGGALLDEEAEALWHGL